MNAHVTPSRKLADEFAPVDLSDMVDDRELRLKWINFFIQQVDLLDRIGWYDHTGDWDFHIGVLLDDGSYNDHIGDGATISWPENHDNRIAYSGDEECKLVYVRGPDHDEDGEEDGLRAYRIETDPVTGEATWAFPIDKIRKLTWGYCS